LACTSHFSRVPRRLTTLESSSARLKYPIDDDCGSTGTAGFWLKHGKDARRPSSRRPLLQTLSNCVGRDRDLRHAGHARQRCQTVPATGIDRLLVPTDGASSVPLYLNEEERVIRTSESPVPVSLCLPSSSLLMDVPCAGSVRHPPRAHPRPTRHAARRSSSWRPNLPPCLICSPTRTCPQVCRTTPIVV
jgi:hypothetical protein